MAIRSETRGTIRACPFVSLPTFKRPLLGARRDPTHVPDSHETSRFGAATRECASCNEASTVCPISLGLGAYEGGKIVARRKLRNDPTILHFSQILGLCDISRQRWVRSRQGSNER